MALGTTEITVIILIVLILFGATAIPKLARSLGRAQGEFKKAKGEFDKEVKAAEKSTAAAAPAVATEQSTEAPTEGATPPSATKNEDEEGDI